MRTIPVAVLSVLVLGVTKADAQDVTYEKGKLDNGMTVILHEDHTVPVAAINLWYAVGSKDEPARRSGFAHLFEHLMFMGTQRVPTGEFDKIMSAGGGNNNASTNEDRTDYHSHGPAALLPTLLWLEADRLESLGSSMTQEKLDRQREVVLNERRQTSENRPYGKADLRLQELLFPEGHPYHIPTIGTHEDIEAASVQDVKDFFATHYVPNNVSLAIAGDFDPDKVKALVKDLFGSIPRGGRAPHKKAAPVSLGHVVHESVVDQVQAPRISIAYHSPARFADGDAEMELLGQILSQGKTSRLYKRLVYDEKLCSTVRASQGSMELGSTFEISLTARPQADLDKIEKIVDEEIDRVLETGPSPDELERVKAEHELQSLSRLQSMERIALRMNEYEYYLGEPDSFKRDLDRYRHARVEDVRGWGREVLNPGERVILRVLPESPRRRESARDTRPGAAEARAFEAPSPQRFQLSNGIPVLVFPRPALPLVETKLVFTPGTVLADPSGKKAGLPSLTAEMLREGAGERDALHFDEELQALGARLACSAGAEQATASLTVLRRNYEKAAGFLADAVRRPRFAPDEWERTKRLRLESLRRRGDQPAQLATDVANRLLYGEKNPFAWPLEGTVASITTLTVDEAKSEHALVFRPEHMTILVAGDVTVEDAQRLLEGAFGDWKVEPAAKPAPLDLSLPEAKGLRFAIVDRPDAVQTVIRFEMPAPSWKDERRVPLRALNAVFGGGFSSRLNQNLREAHGYTYGASSRFSFEPSTGTLVASSSVRADVTGASLKEFLAEFKKIREGTIQDAETSRARETLRADAVEATGELGGLLNIAGDLVVNGASFETWAKDLARLEAVKTADLNALAKDAIPLEKGVLVLVGDRGLILEQTKDLGLPAPLEVDPRSER